MKMTFAQARKEWIFKLIELGWTVHLTHFRTGSILKVPYATKDGCDTVFFHPQAVYQGRDRSSSRSICEDMRNLDDIRHVKGT